MNLGLGLFLGTFAGGDADMALIHAFFGDGSDGDVTVSGSVTLTRDMFYRNLTIAAGAALNPAGFRIFVSEVLDVTAAPVDGIAATVGNGGDAAATAAGAAATALPVRTWQFGSTPVIGKAGGTTTGTAGTAFTASSASSGGTAGTTGGTGGTGSSGAGGAVGTLTAPVLPYRLRYPTVVPSSGSPSNIGGINSASGGSGGGDGTAGGGSGGGASGGGMIGIFARTITRSSANLNAGIISAKGGRGGNGGVPAGGNRGGGGGAPGGGGGSIYILTTSLLGSTHANAFDVTAGKGGDGGAGTGTGTTGLGGQAGYGGTVTVVDLGANTVTMTDKTAVGGTANSSATGGAAVSAQCDL